MNQNAEEGNLLRAAYTDNTAIVESSDALGAFNSGSLDSGDKATSTPPIMQKLSAEALGLAPGLLTVEDVKEQVSFSERLKADGHKIQSGGRKLKCRCPFHDDRTPSFEISIDDNYGSCWGCPWRGDIIQYERDYHQVSFPVALERLSRWLNDEKNAPRRFTRPAVETIPFAFTDEQRRIATDAASLLTADDALIRKIAGTRGWLPETIHKLAADGDLGWCDGKLGFVYSTGLKLRRWPAKDIFWHCGANGLWRDRLLAAAVFIYLTEGETDAISLLDCGLETDPKVAVLAVPGAKAFKEQWTPLFAGKTVITCFDNDQAGQDGARRVHQILGSVVAELRNYSLNGGL